MKNLYEFRATVANVATKAAKGGALVVKLELPLDEALGVGDLVYAQDQICNVRLDMGPVQQDMFDDDGNPVENADAGAPAEGLEGDAEGDPPEWDEDSQDSEESEEEGGQEEYDPEDPDEYYADAEGYEEGGEAV